MKKMILAATLLMLAAQVSQAGPGGRTIEVKGRGEAKVTGRERKASTDRVNEILNQKNISEHFRNSAEKEAAVESLSNILEANASSGEVQKGLDMISATLVKANKASDKSTQDALSRRAKAQLDAILHLEAMISGGKLDIDSLTGAQKQFAVLALRVPEQMTPETGENATFLLEKTNESLARGNRNFEDALNKGAAELLAKKGVSVDVKRISEFCG